MIKQSSAHAIALLLKNSSISKDQVASKQLPLAKTDWRPSFAQARSRVPELLYDISAQYSVDDNINIAIDANQLPAFTRLPEVFIGSKGIARKK